MRIFDPANFFLLVLLLCSSGVAATAKCQLSVRVESEQQNMAAGSHNETRLSRQSHTLLQALADKAGCQLKPIALPAGRAVKMLETGDLTAMVGMSDTSERSSYLYFVGPHHTERMVVMGLRAFKPMITDLNQLAHMPGAISITEGAYYGPQWQSMLQNFPSLQKRLFYASGNQQKLAMLASGRVVASFEDESIVDELLRSHELSGRYTKLFVLHENPVYFAFSRAAITQEFYLQLQQHWEQMLASGEVETIFPSY